MTDWQPIETCPREEDKMYVVAWAGGGVAFLRWKTNSRMVENKRRVVRGGVSGAERAWVEERLATYFGDPEESDDYDLARIDSQPTHWMPLTDPPCNLRELSP